MNLWSSVENSSNNAYKRNFNTNNANWNNNNRNSTNKQVLCLGDELNHNLPVFIRGVFFIHEIMGCFAALAMTTKTARKRLNGQFTIYNSKYAKMAQYLHLPIYKTIYDLMLGLMYATKDFPKEFKFSLGERIQNTLVDTLILVYKANSARDKAPHIEKILENIQYLNLFLRISHDLHIVPDNRYSVFVEQSASAAKQSSAWLNSLYAKQEAAV